MKKTVYIAGPMRGYPLFNFPAFDKARDHLINNGFNVVSPADMDRLEGFDEYAVSPEQVDGNVLREAIQRDVAAICECDMIALLPGWRDSRGARMEVALAEFLDIPVYSLWSKHMVGENQAARNQPRIPDLQETA